ncbi:MAG TPA: FAD-binding oxidoreductase [Candidatus Binataceae bacterium]|nr:FAD-binding oxidoreductase [Candidatus Binataceae bacterium]
MTAAGLPHESRLSDAFVSLLGRECVRDARADEIGVARVIVEPATIGEIAEVVQKCARDRLTLAPLGGGRILAQIRREPVSVGLALRRCARVVAYEPEDLTVAVEAGLTVGQLNELAGGKGQRLAVDPPLPERTTIGSLIAAARSGPLRLSEGTVRDLLIGIKYIGREGRVVNAGGRVVKNVTGYDLMKVMTGSYGTLGVIVEAAFKMRPVPANYTVALAGFARLEEAFDAAFRSSHGAPLLHCEIVSRRIGLALPGSPASANDRRFLLIAGLGGTRAEVDYQLTQIRGAVGTLIEALDGAAAEAVYHAIRDCPAAEATIGARIVVAPSALAGALEAAGAEFCAHAVSGIAQLFLDDVDEQAAHEAVARWRALAHRAGGHLTVVAARDSVRAGLSMFDEPGAGALALMRRLKAAFDPSNIFNPGCYVGGI